MAMMLGKLDPKIDRRTPRLTDLLHRELLPAPRPVADWAEKLPTKLGMMGNDRVGLCTVAAIAHLVQQWTINFLGIEITISDADVLATYKAITLLVNGVSYDEAQELPDGSNPTDTGLACLDVLNYVRKNGIGPDAHGKGMAFVSVNHRDVNEMRIAHELFGGLYTGVALPEVSMRHVGEVWNDTTGPIAGGHAMATHRTEFALLGYITWGDRQPATWAWGLVCMDEAYACLAAEWCDGTKSAPSGFDIIKLRAFLASL